MRDNIRRVQANLPIEIALRGRTLVKDLLDKLGTSNASAAVYPVTDQRAKRTQNYLFAFKEEQLADFFASKRGGLILLACLLSIGLGARFWFRRRQGKQPSVSSGTRGLLISLACLCGLGLVARIWFRQRLQIERLAVSFAGKRGGFIFLALFRRPVADKPEPAAEYSVNSVNSMVAPFQERFSTITTTAVDADREPVATPLLHAPVVAEPEPADEPVAMPFQDEPAGATNATIEDTQDEDTIKLRLPGFPVIVAAEPASEVEVAELGSVSEPVVVAAEPASEAVVAEPRSVSEPVVAAEPASEAVATAATPTPFQRQLQIERPRISFVRARNVFFIFFCIAILVLLGFAIIPQLPLPILTPVSTAHLSTPIPVVKPPTPILAPTPTPIPTAVSVIYPTVAGTYRGTIYNLATRISTSMSLTQIRQNQGAISGYLTLGSNLKGSGPFSGTVDTAHHVRFVVKDATGHATFFFEGAMASSLSGDYYGCSPAPAQGNLCVRNSSSGYGLWDVVLA